MDKTHRFGFLTLTGPPNVGKSTLLNTLVGEKISITSRRPQTTWHRILGIKNLPLAQLVFIDTPGIQGDEKKILNRIINKTAISSLNEVDLVLMMIDCHGWTAQTRGILTHVRNAAAPCVLLINKIDRLQDKRQLLPLIAESRSIFDFKEIVPISAIDMADIHAFLDTLAALLPPGPPSFPVDQVTDRNEQFRAAELIREQMFLMLGQELPYSVAVEIIHHDYNEKGLLRIEATLWVEKDSQKSIVIGKRGEMLKTIGKNARRQLETVCRCRVYLSLWVKVRSRWSENMTLLRSLGYLEI